MCRECAEDSSFPTVIIGDLNRKGKEFIKDLAKTSSIKDQVNFDTFRVKDKNQTYSYRCLDAIATTLINQVTMFHDWVEWTDHALVCMEMAGLTAIKPEHIYDRREIEEVCKDPSIIL